MPTDTRSPLAKLIQELTGEDPVAVIDREYPEKSYRTIATELSKRAGVAVSHETLRRWHDTTADELVEQSSSNQDPAA